ncbi:MULTISPECIES: hypothetical protein [Streptomyces]|uniref:hypothetical protein n=1 Tax=Streptomyces TaxID=1883 RepID=UPI0022487A93|nr:hypothetical protein [Streptomyces sp. JHD 1]MCX2968551.1 hypothetical protein [Streptomyces sp. JHD 1]
MDAFGAARGQRTRGRARWRGDALRRECRRFVHDLALPPARGIRELLPAVEARTGHPIRVASAPVDSALGICGMWLRTVEGVDIVFVHEQTTRAHQDHILAHEVAHILREHRGGPEQTVSHRLFPSLDPSVVARMLGRTDYAYRDEREAELIGSYLQQHVHRPAPAAGEGTGEPVADTLLWKGR